MGEDSKRPQIACSQIVKELWLAFRLAQGQVCFSLFLSAPHAKWTPERPRLFHQSWKDQQFKEPGPSGFPAQGVAKVSLRSAACQAGRQEWFTWWCKVDILSIIRWEYL